MRDDCDNFFGGVLAPAARHLATGRDVPQGDDDWFASAASDTLSADASAGTSASASGAAALSLGEAVVRRAPRTRRTQPNTPDRSGRPGAARLVVAGAALVVVVSVVAVAVNPSQSNADRDQRRAVAGKVPARTSRPAQPAPRRARQASRRSRMATERPADRVSGRTRSPRPQHVPGNGQRPRPPHDPRGSAAPSVAVQRRSLVSARQRPRAARAPSSSFTPGDLPPSTGR